MDKTLPIEIRDSVVMVPTAELNHDPSNPRAHNQKNFDAVMESVKRFGWTQPLVVTRDEKIVIGGNLRLDVAIELKIEKLPVLFVDMTKEEQEAYKIAENRTAELAEWDWQTLAAKVADLTDFDRTLLIGWEDYELEPLLEADWTPPAIEDEMPTNSTGATSDGKDGEPAPSLREQLAPLQDMIKCKKCGKILREFIDEVEGDTDKE